MWTTSFILRDSKGDMNEEELWMRNIIEINNCVDIAKKSLGKQVGSHFNDFMLG